MRRAWSALVLFGALLLLASLFLPWEKAPSGSGQVTGFSNLFADPRTVDGWSSGVGPAAALSAVLLAAVAAVAVARPNLSRRLALGRCALFAGYFVIAVGAGARFSVQRQAVELKGARFHYGYGAYLGIAGGAIALIAAGAMRRRELERFRSASELTIVGPVVGLLVAFLLPWERVEFALLGFQLSDLSFDGGRLEFGYGSTIGFVSAGLVVLLVVVRAWPPAFDSSRDRSPGCLWPARSSPSGSCASGPAAPPTSAMRMTGLCSSRSQC